MLSTPQLRFIVAALFAVGLSTAYGQPPGKPLRVGVLLSGSEAQWSHFDDEIVAGLREKGFVEGRNLVVVRRYGGLKLERIADSAAELAGMELDAIVTSCSNTTRAAMSVTKSTPIVMAGVADPVAIGLVKTLANPGGNVTGVSGLLADMEPKRVELLSRLVPERSRIGVLMNSTNPLHEAHWQRAEAAAHSMNLTAVRIAARGPAGIDAALDELARANVKGLLVLSDDPMNIEFRHRIAAAAARLRLPSVGSSRVYAEDGGLISYGGDTSDGFRKSAEYVAKIANGARAAELPIEQPTRLPLVINLRTATALEIAIPRELLLRADVLIQ
jgi:putative ABC transport system substrate-binding protein